MFVYPFLFGGSFGYCLQIGVQVCMTYLPKRIREQDFDSPQEYNQAIEKIPGYNRKAELQPFLNKMGIRQDLIIREKASSCLCYALGTNFSPISNNATIVMFPDFYHIDKEAYHFAMKHEICHIKSNDCFTMFLIPAICSIAAAIFATYTMPVVLAILVTKATGIFARAMFSQYREAKADDFAIAESSDDELKGGKRFFIALRQSNLEKRTTLWQKIQFSSKGDNRLDFLHTSRSSRLQKIEHALKRGSVQLNEAEENEKINQLKNVMSNMRSKLAQKNTHHSWYVWSVRLIATVIF